MKPKQKADFLRALDSAAKDYLDDLHQWQQEKTPLRLDKTGEVFDEPHPEKEETIMKQYKNKETEFSVRKLRPVTAGIFASLAACGVLAVGLGMRSRNTVPDTASVAEAPDCGADSAEPMLNGPAFSAGRISDQSICWTYYVGDDIQLGARGDLCVLCRETADAAPYVTGSGQQDDYPAEFLRTLTLTSDRNGNSSPDPTDLLLVGFPLIADTDDYALRSLGYTEDGTLHINFAGYRNPNMNMTAETWAQNAYFLLAVPENLPDFTDYSIEYTVFDSNYLSEPQPDDEPDTARPAFAEDPVYQAFRTAILGSKYAANLPAAAACPKFTYIMQSENVGFGASSNAFYLPAQQTLDHTDVPEDLRDRVNAIQSAAAYDSLVVSATVTSPDAQCGLGTFRYADNRLSASVQLRIPENARESEATFLTVMQFPQGSIEWLSSMKEFATTGGSFPAQSSSITVDDGADALMQVYSEPPYIERFGSAETAEAVSTDITVVSKAAEVTEATEVTDATDTRPTVTMTYPNPTQIPDVTVPRPEKTPEKIREENGFALPEGYVSYAGDADEGYGLTAPVSGKKITKIACSNTFLANNLGVWFIPTQQEARQFLEYTDTLDGTESDGSYFREVTGGGFLIQIGYDDGTAECIEVASDGNYRIEYLPADGNPVTVCYHSEDAGTVDKLVYALQNAQVSRDETITAIADKMQAFYKMEQ